MNSNGNIDSKKLAALLSIASQKLGTDPATLKSQLESGSFEKALGNMPQGQAQKLRQAMSDPKTAEKLLSDPKAKEIYKKLQK